MNIKKLRQQLGLSQQELANSIGVPKSRLSQWELGNGKPKATDAENLTKYFAKQGLVADLREQAYQEYDIGMAVRKMEAISEVSLSVLAEVLAKISDRSATAVLDEIQELVNRRLNAKVPGQST